MNTCCDHLHYCGDDPRHFHSCCQHWHGRPGKIAPHHLDPPAMTEAERLAKRRFEAGFVFEMMPDPERSTPPTRIPKGGEST